MDIENKRLITDKEGAFLYGMSINSFRELSKRIGADVYLGRKKLNKKASIDNWIDRLPSGADIKFRDETNGDELSEMDHNHDQKEAHND